jgi:alkanesulfonate monooxygenase SsuD/methylene tetrahydromethanopterin reductase-like flavin-dependent oxidoreductase (luciferase family)
MAATLQTLSGGRFILSIGAGWREEEYDAYGYEFPSVATRLRQLDEVVQICRLMWTEKSPSFEGKHFQIREAMAPPLPDPPPPICIGSQGEQIGLPLVGRQADMWNAFFPANEEDWIRKRDIVWRSAEEAGRDPASIEISATREAPLPTSDEESAEWLETLQHWAEIGISHFVLDFGHVTSTELIERFAEQVIKPMKSG